MEKVPRKQHKKGLKKPFLILLPLGIGLLCLGIIWLLNATRPMPALPEDEAPILLLSRSSQEIQSISLWAQDQQGFTLIRTQEGSFVLEGQEEIPLQNDLIDSLLSTLHQLEAAHGAGEMHEGDDLTPFGLSPAQAASRITYQDGEEITLLLGSSAPTDTPELYCMIEGQQQLYTIYTQLAEPLLYEKDYLRAFDQPQLDASLLDRIEISGDLEFSLAYTPSGWLMDAPFSYPLSTLATDTLLKRIESMAFESCLGSPEEVDMAALGLDAPFLTIHLDQAATVISGETTEGEMISMDVPPRRYTLHIGSETGKSGVYLQWEGRIYKASNFLMGFWKEMDIASYLLQTPVNLYINDLTFLAVETDGISKAYEIQMVEGLTDNNQIATDEYGQILYDALITRQGEEKPMDAQTFLSWYVSLSNLIPSGKLPTDYQIEGDPLARLTLQTPSLTREIAFYPYDPLYDALAVNGVCLYFVENSWRSLLSAAP